MQKVFATTILASLSVAYDLNNNLGLSIGSQTNPNDPDADWPTDDCCRIYKGTHFEGAWRDFCASEKTDQQEPPIFGLSGDPDWDNTMSSWKCGPEVGVMWCFEKPHSETTAVPFEDGPKSFINWEEDWECLHSLSESGMSMGYNNEVGHSGDYLSSIILYPYDPEETPMIQIFSEINCSGYSGLVYESIPESADYVTKGKRISSFIQPKNTRVKLWSEANYTGFSFVSDNDIDDQICVTVTYEESSEWDTAWDP